MNFQDLSTLKRAVENDLKVLQTYQKLLDYDAKNPIADITDSVNIGMMKKYFPCYIQALEGITELLSKHMSVFEKAHAKEQEAATAQRKVAEAERREKLAEEKQRLENKKNSSVSLFDNDKPEEGENALC
jgi:ribosomal protein L12E/L44/L45/RPP1/RPP2